MGVTACIFRKLTLELIAIILSVESGDNFHL